LVRSFHIHPKNRDLLMDGTCLPLRGKLSTEDVLEGLCAPIENRGESGLDKHHGFPFRR
jgi:hypothetical protein